jgi:putative intracellular protease/amidase
VASRLPRQPPPTDWRERLEKSTAKRRRIARKLVTLVVLVALGATGYWLYGLPGTPDVAPPPPIAQSESDALVNALKPTKRDRPVIAVVGLNEGTETTDYLMPYGILKRADVAEVVAIAPGSRRIRLYPALSVQPDSTIAAFDEKYADGADYVIVPAMKPDDDAEILRWLRAQSAKGAMIVGVCAGATVVANAGLLDDKRATTHWYYRKDMLAKHPSIRYVRDRRFVVDQGVMTTTGISASMPMSLTLIESIAGREKALAVAGELGLTHWNSWHASDAYVFSRPFVLRVARNKLAFWRHEMLGLELKAGADEVSLALVADALSRTYRSQVRSYAASRDAIVTKSGLALVPDEARTDWPSERKLEPFWERPASIALDHALADVAARYGKGTRQIVAAQLEYSN